MSLVRDLRGWLAPPERPGYAVSCWLLVRGLGLVFLIAFVSLWVQISGLVGERGITPVGEFLQMAGRQLGAERFHLLPTLCWLAASDASLHAQCAAGAGAAVLLLAGVLPVPSLALCWLLYLSLSVAAQEFCGFQWDILLLEAAAVGLLLAPWSARHRLKEAPAPSRPALLLVWWLLFRLMFSSGAVKLTSGDPAWRNLTALTVHYETQPLPTWIGWWAHQLPAGFHVVSCALMFGVELLVPFLIFFRLTRRLAFPPFLGLQALIGLTGNYTFFNVLSVLLALPLLDDALLARLGIRGPDPAVARARGWPPTLSIALAALLFLPSLPHLAGALRARLPFAPLAAMANWLAPFRTVNGYGLFAVMTSDRPEIVVEGSRDGEEWLPYEMKWKPGDPARRPRFVEPHQPRLDWQLWFAALSRVQENPWFLAFLRRLLEGSPPVLALLGKNPFPEAPPRYVRASVYDYRFTDRATRRREGTWWRRDYHGLYCPPLSLSEGELRVASAPSPAEVHLP